MNLISTIKKEIKSIFEEEFKYQCDLNNITIDNTPKNFTGFYTLIIFPHIKSLKMNPKEIGDKIGKILLKKSKIVGDFNVVKGFLNMDLRSEFLISLYNEIKSSEKWGFKKCDGDEIMVEFSSPNTNKPLHLGHLRNIFLGDSLSTILEANGKKVHRVQIINDRGIHISKSMVAWKLYSENKTPESEGIKGDKFVGDYYVKFEKENRKQYQKLLKDGTREEDAINNTNLMIQAKKILKSWELKDEKTLKLWEKMNNWVYEGFNETYDLLGITFDKNYYESETYLLGKENVISGLNKNIFYEEDDGSVWVDLTNEKFDKKILLRNDGTSVYITQDIGTAIKRFEDYPKITKQIYTVGSEQDYHFKVLFKILEKLNYDWAKECYHLSYGMIELPDGKMKSREGKVVDADDLILHMIKTSEKRIKELGKTDDFNVDDLNELYKMIALGALKYFLLKVDPKKKMLFNPDDSIDFQGNTGPFIQYTYARICSITDRAESLDIEFKEIKFDNITDISLPLKKLINHIYQFPNIIDQAASNHSPSIVAQYIFDLSKIYNSFYQEEKIFDNTSSETTSFKIALSHTTAKTIKDGMMLLGISVPNKM
tara:strand:+ start:14235 stop:16028 length:1794 start_codon:yes stop_codon:yes gene_type:complete